MTIMHSSKEKGGVWRERVLIFLLIATIFCISVMVLSPLFEVDHGEDSTTIYLAERFEEKIILLISVDTKESLVASHLLDDTPKMFGKSDAEKMPAGAMHVVAIDELGNCTNDCQREWLYATPAQLQSRDKTACPSSTLGTLKANFRTYDYATATMELGFIEFYSLTPVSVDGCTFPNPLVTEAYRENGLPTAHPDTYESQKLTMQEKWEELKSSTTCQIKIMVNGKATLLPSCHQNNLEAHGNLLDVGYEPQYFEAGLYAVISNSFNKVEIVKATSEKINSEMWKVFIENSNVMDQISNFPLIITIQEQ